VLPIAAWLALELRRERRADGTRTRLRWLAAAPEEDGWPLLPLALFAGQLTWLVLRAAMHWHGVAE
jgi:hypothetical protein